jgi:hypothetical protein
LVENRFCIEVEKRTFVILTLMQMTLLLPKIKLLGVESVVVIIIFFIEFLDGLWCAGTIYMMYLTNK